MCTWAITSLSLANLWPMRPTCSVVLHAVTPGVYRTLETLCWKGVCLIEEDRIGTTAVVVVNQAIAHQYLGDQPLGKRLNLDLGPCHEKRVERCDGRGCCREHAAGCHWTEAGTRSRYRYLPGAGRRRFLSDFYRLHENCGAHETAATSAYSHREPCFGKDGYDFCC